MLQYLIKLTAGVMVVFLPYLIIRRPWRRRHKREIALAIFVIFMSVLFMLAFDGDYNMPSVMIAHAKERIRTMYHINLHPFKTIKMFYVYFNWAAFMLNIVGNILMFVPWGFGLALLWKKNQSPIRIMAYLLFLTMFIEALQLFINRNVDIDDIILNFLGGCLGALFYYILKKIMPGIGKYAI